MRYKRRLDNRSIHGERIEGLPSSTGRRRSPVQSVVIGATRSGSKCRVICGNVFLILGGGAERPQHDRLEKAAESSDEPSIRII